MPDQEEITSILDSHVKLKDENASLRARLQETDAEARKVPALEAESERLRSRLEAVQEDLSRERDARTALREDLSKRESIQREQETLEEEINDANEAAERADAAREEAEEALSKCKLQNADLGKKLDEQDKEIARLQHLERLTQADVKTRKALEEAI